jgi:hypothetical protein
MGNVNSCCQLPLQKVMAQNQMELFYKKTPLKEDVEILPYTCILREAILDFLDFILAFLILGIRNDLLELMKWNHSG